MRSEAKTAANRRNARKSTGPRSLEGKTIVARNAIDHGLPARISGGHSPPYPAEANSAKQSQSPVARPAVLPSPVETQQFASLSPRPKMQPPTANPCPAEPARAACETKPAGGMTACTETQDVASLHYDKQSQSAGQALVSCETKPTEAGGAVCSVLARVYKETPCGVATNGIDSAKQSQRAEPVKGFVMVPRHARYAWHYHSLGRRP